MTSVSRDVRIELTSPEILLVSVASDSRLAPRVCLGSATIELIVSKRASTTALRYDPSYSKYGITQSLLTATTPPGLPIGTAAY